MNPTPTPSPHPGWHGNASPTGGLDPAAFLDPGPEFRGVALWMLNDQLDADEAARQLRGFHQAGWGAVITRTYWGTRISYLGDQWLTLVDRILEVSREQGTRVFLQEADTKVGGYVTTALLGMEDRFRHRRLVTAPAGDAAPPNSTLLTTVDERSYYDQMVVAPGEAAQFFAVMDLLDDETVQAFMRRCHDAQAEHHGEEFGEAIEAVWMDEPFLCFRNWTRLPALPWTARLPELFAREWGYSLLEHLPSLFLNVGDFQRIRHHFWRTVVARFKQAYWEPIGRWCAAHRVKFAGHLMGEDTMHDQISWSGAIMPFYEDMQLPGIDYLTKDIATWRPVGSKFIITPKQCSSAANQLGKREVLSEMYGVSDQGLTFEDRKWIAEWLAALGINYRCYHAAFYALRGGRKRMYPPHIGHQQPYWEDNWRLAKPMARLCYALRQGAYLADLLVLHPLESAHCLFVPAVGRPCEASPPLRDMDQALISLSDNLLAIHRGFDYGDEYLLAKYGQANGKTLTVGQMKYRAVVLPGLVTIRSSTVKLLEAFLEGGGTVLSVGDLPTRIDGVSDPRLKALNRRIIRVENSQPALKQELDRRLPTEVELSGPGCDQVWLHERRLGNQRLVFLVNTSRSQSAEGELRLPGRGKLEQWDTSTGEQATIPQWSADPVAQAPSLATIARLTFAPAQSHLLVFHPAVAQAPSLQQPPDSGPAKPVGRGQSRGPEGSPPSIPLGPSFGLRRHHPNALTLDFCRYQLADAKWSDLLPVIGIAEKLARQGYSGPIQLQYTFSAEERPGACAIVVEDPEQCRITINGVEVQPTDGAYYWDRGFHRIDITGQVQRGENLVAVSRHYRAPDPDAVRDHERFYGTDLEAIYVIGDFAVRMPGSPGSQSGHPSRFALVPEAKHISGDLLAEGYPFYAGRMTLSQDLTLSAPAQSERVFLDLGRLLAAIAHVRLNGKEAGAILWAPYRVEMTGLVREGVNRLEVDLINTLRNLLGPHHYTGAERQQVWQTHFTALLEDRDWMDTDKRGQLSTWSDAYEFVPFSLAEDARIVYERIAG